MKDGQDWLGCHLAHVLTLTRWRLTCLPPHVEAGTSIQLATPEPSTLAERKPQLGENIGMKASQHHWDASSECVALESQPPEIVERA